MKTAYGYVRVSTPKQGEGVSLPEQRRIISEFAERNGLEITQWFEERQTAAKTGRRQFNQMLRQLNARRVDAVVLHKIDRSARNLKDWGRVTDLLDLGVDVRFAIDDLDMTSRSGRLAADLQAVIAADFIRNQREETKKGLRGRLNQGLYPFAAPIGYLDRGRGKVKEPCPIKGPMIREAYRRYATGQYSLKSLLTEMHTLGLCNVNGQPISLHGLETILHNRFYTGIIEIKRTGEVFPGQHQALISKRLFRQVQTVLAGKAGKKVTRHNHLYRGLFRCGLCGAPMSPERQKGRVYYRCQEPTCATKTVREDALEARLAEAYRALSLSRANVERLQYEWLHPANAEEDAEAIASHHAQLQLIEQRMARLTDLLLDDKITAEQHDTKRRELEEAKFKAQDAIEIIEESRPSDAMVRRFLELMKNLAELHELANPAEKRQLAEITFSNRTVCRKKVVLEPDNWLQEIEKCEFSQVVTQIGPLLELLPQKDNKFDA